MSSGTTLHIEAVERQVKALRQQVRALEERLDTVCSPPWKRLWWFLQGYRWYSVGRWYGGDKTISP